MPAVNLIKDPRLEKLAHTLQFSAEDAARILGVKK